MLCLGGVLRRWCSGGVDGAAGVPGGGGPGCGAGLLGVPVGGGPPVALLVVPGCLVCSWAAARPPSALRASLGASTRCPARPCRRPPAPRPRLRSSDALHAGGAWFADKCPSFRNFACNSPLVSCWFVSVCNVTSLVFLNCMRLLSGPRLRPRASQPGPPDPPVPSRPAAPEVLCVVVRRLVVRQAPPLPTGTAARPSGPSGALHTGGA